MLAGLSGWHIVIIVAVILVLFGATKLPLFAKGLGQSIKIFRNEVAQDPTPEAKKQAEADTAEKSPVSEPRSPGSSSN